MGVTQGWVSEPMLLIVVLYLICYLRNIMGGNARVGFGANVIDSDSLSYWLSTKRYWGNARVGFRGNTIDSGSISYLLFT